MTISDPAAGVVSSPSPVASANPYVVTIRATQGANTDDQTWLLTVDQAPARRQSENVLIVR
jgi:hypothetical protein